MSSGLTGLRDSAGDLATALPRRTGPGASIDISLQPGPVRRQGRRPFEVRPLWALALGVIVAVVAAGVGVVVVTFGDRGDGSPRPDAVLIASAVSERSIPEAVDTLWSTRLPGTGTALATNLIIDGRDLVVAVVDDGSRDRAGIIGLDAVSGEIRWRRSFSFSPPEVQIVGVVGDRLILEQQNPYDRQLLALDTTDGSTAWEREATIAASNVIFEGTEVIAQIFPGGDASGGATSGQSVAIFVDPLTGLETGTIVGRSLTSDLTGRWYFGNDEAVVAVDLANGWSEPTVLSTAGIGPFHHLGIVDGRPIVVSRRGNIDDLAAGPEISIQDLALLASADDGDFPILTTIVPSGGSTFVGLADGLVVGADLDAEDIQSTWQMAATMRNSVVTERGLLLSLSQLGAGFVEGNGFVVVDALTGERLASSGPAPRDDQPPLIVGDGFIVTRESVTGSERIGYDLDGGELWRLEATGTLRVGDEIVVTLNNTPSGFHVTAYGDLPE